MDQLQLTATFPNIAPEKLDEFKQVMAEILEVVKAKDPGTTQYDLFLSADGTKAVAKDSYSSSDALMAHMGNLGELLGKAAELGGGLEVELYGNPSDTLREAAAAMQPTVYSYIQGL